MNRLGSSRRYLTSNSPVSVVEAQTPGLYSQRSARYTEGNPIRALVHHPQTAATAFIGAHTILPLIAMQNSVIGTAHALLTVGLGMWWALTGKPLVQIIRICVYIAGAEVLWRMLKVNPVWEYGKFAIVAILVLTILRHRLFNGPVQSVIYVAALLPSAFVTMSLISANEARSHLSFNLAGPIVLALGIWVFSRTSLTREQFRTVLVAMLCPAISMLMVASNRTFTAEMLSFTNASNFTTSGGFGPNQVSAALGFGAFAAFWLVIATPLGRFVRLLLVSTIVIMLGQAALTLSRGGVYIVLCSIVVAAVLLIRDRRSRTAIVGTSVVGLLLANFIVFPQLDSFTGGALGERFQNTDTTGRLDLIDRDLSLFLENPVLGVGVGMARDLGSDQFGRSVAAHTEFTRLLAEHGIMGILALLLIGTMSWRQFRRSQTPMSQALVASMICWSALFMAVDATRIAAPSILMSLAFVALVQESAGLGNIAQAPGQTRLSSFRPVPHRGKLHRGATADSAP